MEATIYIDVVFLVSWGMHTFLLWSAGRIAGFSTKTWRAMLGGFFSAFIYCLELCLFRGDSGILLSVFLLGLGLVFAYYPKQGRNWCRLFVSVWAVSFLMGGAVNVLFTLTQAQGLFGKGFMIQQTYPWWFSPWAVGMAYICLKISAKWLQANIQRRKEYCTAYILWRGKGLENRVLIDTGNGLVERGRGVAVIQLSAMLSLFSEEEQMQIFSGNMQGLDWMSYSSLGNPDGRLWGIRCEKLILSYGEKKIIHKNIFVGINFEDFAGAYEGLVPPCLLEEE